MVTMGHTDRQTDGRTAALLNAARTVGLDIIMFCLCVQRILLLIGSLFVCNAQHFRLYSLFCACHSRMQKLIFSGLPLALSSNHSLFFEFSISEYTLGTFLNPASMCQHFWTQGTPGLNPLMHKVAKMTM